MEFLTNKAPVLKSIVVFRSTCTAHRDPKNKSLGERGKAGIIIGRGRKTKGYKVCIPVDKVVVVIQHVQNVKAPQDDQDKSRKIYPNTVGHQEEPCGNHRTEDGGHRNTEKGTSKLSRGRKATWTRDRHDMRSMSMSQPDTAKIDTSSGQQGIVTQSSHKTQGTVEKR